MKAFPITLMLAVGLSTVSATALHNLNSLHTESDIVASYERQWAELEFPSPGDFKLRRGKPFTVNVEGIVGTGKSTLLQSFSPYPSVDVLPEPVSKWTDLNGTDLLQLIYDDPQRWALAQESFVQLTMLEEHLRKEGVAKVMERSIHAGRYIFVESLRQSGALSPVEYEIIAKWYDFLNDVPEFDLSTDLTIYLQTNPKVVMERITRRGRKEEAHITMDFLNSIQRLHEDWLVHKNTTFPIPSKKVVVINTSYPLATMKKIYKSLAKKIWAIVPQEVKAAKAGCKLNIGSGSRLSDLGNRKEWNTPRN